MGGSPLQLVAAVVIHGAAAALRQSGAGPMDVQAYVDERRFYCAKAEGCPLLSHTWGQVIATDPSTGKTATFRDVMAGPGWAKEWNWGHHPEHVTHATGPMTPDVEEIMQEMKLYNPKALNLDRFYMSIGVKGALANNQTTDDKIKEMWGIEPVVGKTEELVEEYDKSQSKMFLLQSVERYNSAVCLMRAHPP